MKGFAFFGANCVWYEDNALRDLLNRDREREDILLRFEEAARELLTAARETHASPQQTCFTTSRRRYECQFSAVRDPLNPADVGVVVFVQAHTNEHTMPDRLAKAFGLTNREAEVALLVRARQANQEIAQQLGISPNTVRHHVQRVIRKVGVRTRREVREAIERRI